MEGPQVQLFVTCLVDSLTPEVGRATVNALEKAGCSVDVPAGQGCCGQPAFNVGLHEEARVMAAHTLDVLDSTEGPVVVPSGSCTAMITRHYEELF
jgi:L-lactate dehydrogenase complex protein LldE